MSASLNSALCRATSRKVDPLTSTPARASESDTAYSAAIGNGRGARAAL